MLKDRAWIEQHLPHKGAMCLLDAVLEWSASEIRCSSAAHRAGNNPLRAHGRLAAICGIEFAAQAMALHGAVLAPVEHSAQRAGYLASARAVALEVARLDTIEDDLIVTAQRVTGDAFTVLYSFSLQTASKPLLSGRAAIVLNPALLSGMPVNP